MLREEGDINTYKYEAEVNLASASMKGNSSYKGESVSECGKECEDSAYGKDIVEMSYNVVSIVEDNIKRGIG